MYSFPVLEPVCFSMSRSNCCILTCIQISQEAGEVAWYSHFLKNFQQFVVIHPVKGFGIVNKAEVDVFFWNSVALLMIQWMLALWSLAPLPFLNPSWTFIWKFMVHILLEPGLENFEHYFARVWDKCSCLVVWAFFGIAFLWHWNENWPFQALWPLLSFPNFAVMLSVALSQHHLLGLEIAQQEFHHLL